MLEDAAPYPVTWAWASLYPPEKLMLFMTAPGWAREGWIWMAPCWCAPSWARSCAASSPRHLMTRTWMFPLLVWMRVVLTATGMSGGKTLEWTRLAVYSARLNGSTLYRLLVRAVGWRYPHKAVEALALWSNEVWTMKSIAG